MIHIASHPDLRRPGYRYNKVGIGFPNTARPEIELDHIDGPVLIMRDGSMHWLTLWERLNVWIGRDDAMTLESRLRPDLIDLENDNVWGM